MKELAKEILEQISQTLIECLAQNKINSLADMYAFCNVTAQQFGLEFEQAKEIVLMIADKVKETL